MTTTTFQASHDVTRGIAVEQIPITALIGVGPRITELLASLHIHNVQDLLFHLPLRYQDRTRITAIASLQVGDQVLVEGVIAHGNVAHHRRRSLVCHVSDDSGQLTLRFFHFSASQRQRLLTKGLRVRCFGEVRQSFNAGLEMVHPECRWVDEQRPPALADRLTPIYPITKGLAQTTLRKLMAQALALLQRDERDVELLPQEIVQRWRLPRLRQALAYIHQPPARAATTVLQAKQHPMQQRLALEELIAQQLGLQRWRNKLKQRVAPALKPVALEASPRDKDNGLCYPDEVALGLQAQLCRQLPFRLTAAQCRVISEINRDLAAASPMLRLVQGDVGSGKTLVALMAMLRAVENGMQAVFMAPTELLVEQHIQSFQRYLEPLAVTMAWLTGSQTQRQRQVIMHKLKHGEVQVIIGTHALFQAGVAFANLALIIIDEQHRFGVQQRLALQTKGMQYDRYPHQLIMTATPIPRTLAMTAYVDLDISVIDELPPGRKPIDTWLVPNARRCEVIERIRANCLRGHQVYWVCTLIEQSEDQQCQAAVTAAEQLCELLPELNVGLVHGRQSLAEKEGTMRAFKDGGIAVLVATTVIEVGVDVPNANLMVIENPERLGLAQLHQLRGRVGRGATKSHCVLLYQKPLARVARQRLAIMKRTHDGFVIAREDLHLRGPGQILGIRQAGLIKLQVADLLRDSKLLPQAGQAGEWIVTHHPELITPLMRRWLRSVEQYIEV